MQGAAPLGPDFTYVQVANAIAARINAGEISYKLPACRHMACEFGVAYQTVRHSLQLLQDRGLIITRPGRGTFVAYPALPAGSPAEMSEPLTCDLGGLTALTHVELTAASMHIARCCACQLEFVRRGGLLPRPAKDDS
jgi:GntR family transcriptional regulator